jgi:hypothetical protein
MKMIRQDLPTAQGTGLPQLLKQATNDGKKAAADLCSARLDKLATHAVNFCLTANEIIELIRQESENLSSKGGASWQ